MHKNGGVFFSGVTESFKVLLFFSGVTESFKVILFYCAVVQNFFSRVYFDLGAMQKLVLLSGTRCHAEACISVWYQRDLRLSGCAGPHGTCRG